MLAMGDELGRTQRGNNNAYAQDNALTWVDWDRRRRRARRRSSPRSSPCASAHPALRADRWLTGAPADASGIADVEWRHPDGRAMNDGDWTARRRPRAGRDPLRGRVGGRRRRPRRRRAQRRRRPRRRALAGAARGLRLAAWHRHARGRLAEVRAAAADGPRTMPRTVAAAVGRRPRGRGGPGATAPALGASSRKLLDRLADGGGHRRRMVGPGRGPPRRRRRHQARAAGGDGARRRIGRRGARAPGRARRGARAPVAARGPHDAAALLPAARSFATADAASASPPICIRCAGAATRASATSRPLRSWARPRPARAAASSASIRCTRSSPATASARVRITRPTGASSIRSTSTSPRCPISRRRATRARCWSEAARASRACRARHDVDYPGVWDVKRAVLDACFAQFERRSINCRSCCKIYIKHL